MPKSPRNLRHQVPISETDLPPQVCKNICIDTISFNPLPAYIQILTKRGILRLHPNGCFVYPEVHTLEYEI